MEGLLAAGDLTGPGIGAPIQLTTAPGHRFQIPGFAQQGVYTLQNVRLMKGSEFRSSGRTLRGDGQRFPLQRKRSERAGQ